MPWTEVWMLPGRLVAAEPLILTSGMTGVEDLSVGLGVDCGVITGSGAFCADTGLGGAGTTPVIPSGPSMLLP